jgi:MFS family permease
VNPKNGSMRAAELRARRSVATLFLLNGIVMGSWAAHIPLTEDRLGIGHAALGSSLLAMAAGALVAMPFAGAGCGRFGSAKVIRWASVASLLCFLLPIFAPNALSLPFALFIFGAVNGAIDIAMNAHGVAVERLLRRPVMSSFHGMWSLGGLAGAGLAAALLPVLSPVMHALLIVALAFAANLYVLHGLLPSKVDSGASGSVFAWPGRASLGLGFLAVLALLTEGAVLDWSALHLKITLGLDAGTAASGYAAFCSTMAAGRFAGDWLRGHVGAVALVRISALIGAVALLIALFAPFPALAIIGFGVVGLGLSNLVPVFFGAAGHLPDQAPGSSIAAVATMGYAGFLAGPPLIGFLAQETSLASALSLAVAACLVIALGAAAVGPAQRSVAVPA